MSCGMQNSCDWIPFALVLYEIRRILTRNFLLSHFVCGKTFETRVLRATTSRVPIVIVYVAYTRIRIVSRIIKLARPSHTGCSRCLVSSKAARISVTVSHEHLKYNGIFYIYFGYEIFRIIVNNLTELKNCRDNIVIYILIKVIWGNENILMFIFVHNVW